MNKIIVLASPSCGRNHLQVVIMRWGVYTPSGIYYITEKYVVVNMFDYYV